MRKEDYIETIVVNGKMINVGVDDYGQTFYLEFLDDKTGELVEACVGPWETDYIGYAEMLFEDPKHCEHYEEATYCEEMAHTYCSNCDKYFLSIERDKRFMRKYGMTYKEYNEGKIK